MKLTRKRRAFIAAYFSIASGAAVAKWIDLASGVALMMAGVWAVGKLQREGLPDDHRMEYTDGHKTPRPSKKEPPCPPR